MKIPYVLVVDDNRITTRLLARYLQANGYEAGSAYDGVECLDSIAKRRPDVIVMDVMMPRMDGYECIKQIRGNPKIYDIPIVLLCAMNDIANQLKAVRTGADDFLAKPVEEELLVAKVRVLAKIPRASVISEVQS